MSLFRALSSSLATASAACTWSLLSLRPLHATAALQGMPGVKKRRKVDPALVRAREERRVRRINKALRKMGKKDRVLKPLLETEVRPQLRQQVKDRARGGAVRVDQEEEEERRALLFKEWNRFCGRRHRQELRAIDRVMLSQHRALEALKEASPYLYSKAIEIDSGLLPMTIRGPTRTPPIPQHLVDGEYKDATKQFEVQYADMEQFMKSLVQRDRRKRKKTEDEE